MGKVKKEGKLIPGRSFSLLVKKRDDENFPRFAFIISKRIHKRATKRNHARRLLVEAVRAFLPKVKPGFDFVFLVKREIVGKKLPEIKKEVEEICTLFN